MWYNINNSLHYPEYTAYGHDADLVFHRRRLFVDRIGFPRPGRHLFWSGRLGGWNTGGPGRHAESATYCFYRGVAGVAVAVAQVRQVRVRAARTGRILADAPQ